MSTTVIAPPLPDAPYRGIEPFRFTDQQIFAAREDETWTLLSNVTLYRAVLLYGESGTGKSSLVNAGLLPQVLKENYVPDRLRVQPIAGREFKVERIRMSTEGDQPNYLLSNFVPSEVSGPAESFELSLKDFRARLEEFRSTAGEEASGGLFVAPRSAPRPLLIFDQFEEFITLFEEAQRVGTSAETSLALTQVPAAQQDILATLVELIQDETLPVKIIFSFREDYLAKLSILFDLCPELLDQAQRLLPPGIEALAQIIRAPFTDPALRAHFLQQEGGKGSELSEALAEKIARELGRRSKGDTANLTELQIVCQRLWQTDDPEKLFSADGIEGLLTGYGADVFRHFTPEMRTAAVVLLSHMVTASNTRNIVSEEDLLSRTTECDFDTAQCSDALAALSRSQIVRREPRHSIYFYEITSEYLVPWIKEQVAERKLADEQFHAAEAQKKLEAQRAEAVTRFEAARSRERKLRYVVTAMILLLAATVFLAVGAYGWYRDAAAAKEQARLAKLETERIVKALTLVASKDANENKQGIVEFETLVKDEKISPDLASVAIQNMIASQDKTVHQASYDFLLGLSETNPTVEQSIVKAAETNPALAEKIPPRFYIHYSDDSQRPQAERVAAALKRQGYLIPPMEKRKGDAKANQLRFFRRDEPGMPKPDDLVALLRNASPGNWRALQLQSSGKMRPGHFEIWFAAVEAQPVEETPTGPGTLVLLLVDYDGNTLSGVPRVKINLDGDSAYGSREQTGTEFRLDEGEYELNVNLKDYEPDDFRASVKPGRTTTLRVQLKRKAEPIQAGPPRQRTPG